MGGIFIQFRIVAIRKWSFSRRGQKEASYRYRGIYFYIRNSYSPRGKRCKKLRAMQPEYKDAVNRCDTSVRVVGPRAHISRTKDRFFSDQVFNSFDDAPWKRLLPTLENLGSGARCGHLPVYFIPETAYAYAWKIHAELNNISISKFYIFLRFFQILPIFSVTNC